MPREGYQDRARPTGGVYARTRGGVDSGLARQSSRQVGLIELGAATVIHNMHTQGSRASNERMNVGERTERRRSPSGCGGWKSKGEKYRRGFSPSRARPRACNVCARPGFASIIDTECTYGGIMHPRGGTFACSQTYPGCPSVLTRYFTPRVRCPFSCD